MRSRWQLAAGFLAAISLPPAAKASTCSGLLDQPARGEKRPVTAEDLIGLRDIGPLVGTSGMEAPFTVSPDGRFVAFQIRRAELQSNGYCLGVFVLGTYEGSRPLAVDVGGELITVTNSIGGIFGYDGGVARTIKPKWARDGQSVAFLKRVGGRTQVWRASIDGKRSEQLTDSPVDVAEFAWSGDGQSIIYATHPSLPAVQTEVDREAARGFLYDDRFNPRLSSRPFPVQPIPKVAFALDVRSHLQRTATEFEQSLLEETRPPPVPTDAVKHAKSPNGNVAWTRVAGPLPQDESLIVVLASGRRIECRARACSSGIKGLWWSADGEDLRILRSEGWAESQTALYRWKPTSGRIVRTLLTEDLVAGCQPFQDDLICAHEAATQPRRLAVLHAVSGRLDPIFDPNPGFSLLSLAPAKRLRWRNAIGFEVFGDLVLPLGHKPGERHPLIIVQYVSRGFLRGGVGDEYPIQLFAAHGYAVLSFHRPLDFGFSIKADDIYQRIRADNADWTDRRSVNSALEAGVDLAVAEGYVDPHRVGITGLSEGSAAVGFALVNSDRYAAAAASQLSSHRGTMSIYGPAYAREGVAMGYPRLTDPGLSAYWAQGTIGGNPGKVHTPLLLQVPDTEYLAVLDSYTALRELNIPVELYVFENEKHIKLQPSHREAVYRRSLQWFDFWMLGRKSASPLDPEQYSRWEAMKANAPPRASFPVASGVP